MVLPSKLKATFRNSNPLYPAPDYLLHAVSHALGQAAIMSARWACFLSFVRFVRSEDSFSIKSIQSGMNGQWYGASGGQLISL
jgi:hypothetical protein